MCLARALVLGALTTVAACGAQAPPAPVGAAPPSIDASAPAPLPAAPRARHPDAAGLADVVSKIDPACNNTCCLPEVTWFWGKGDRLSEDDAKAVRPILDDYPSHAPAIVALALRLLARGLDEQDVPRFARLVNDTRAAGRFPFLRIVAPADMCGPFVEYRPTSPSVEALAAFNLVLGLRIERPEMVKVWLGDHPDYDAFEVWLARASRVPLDPNVAQRLRAKDALLYARVMLVCAKNGEGCGTTPDELGAALKAAVSSDKILAWLDGSWSIFGAVHGVSVSNQEGYGNMAVVADRVLGPESVPALEKMMRSTGGGPSAGRATIAAILARLVPEKSTAYLVEALSMGAFDRRTNGDSLALRELAKRDPVGGEGTLRSWLFHAPRTGTSDDAATAIFTGLAQSDARTGAAVFGRLLSKPLETTDLHVLDALSDAAEHFGCGGLPTKESLRPTKNTRNLTAEQIAADGQRAGLAARALTLAARACGEKTSATPPR
jgi:hypothetical protein